MNNRSTVVVALGCAILAVLAGGASGSSSGPSAPPTSEGPAQTAEECPVTLPTQAVLPDDAPADQLFGSESSYGNGELWVGGLGPLGIIMGIPEFVDEDGAVNWKLGWWRAVAGSLEITGRRLDAPAPPLQSEVPEGYGESGFQASGVIFPTEGCWEVTGTVGATTLMFVVIVLKVPAFVPVDSSPPPTG